MKICRFCKIGNYFMSSFLSNFFCLFKAEEIKRFDHQKPDVCREVKRHVASKSGSIRVPQTFQVGKKSLQFFYFFPLAKKVSDDIFFCFKILI